MAGTDGGVDRILQDLTEFEHDVIHELSTIAILAELLREPGMSEPERQLRARQLIGEVCWLRRFVRSEQNRLLRRDGLSGASSAVRIHVLVADLAATVRLLTRAHVDLVVEPVAVRADRVALGRALRNLIWNAIDAAGPGGQVQLTVRAVGRHAAVEIGNSVHPSAPSGEGIGLCLVREIVSKLGGTLRIESTADAHRVTLRLPMISAGKDESCAS